MRNSFLYSRPGTGWFNGYSASLHFRHFPSSPFLALITSLAETYVLIPGPSRQLKMFSIHFFNPPWLLSSFLKNLSKSQRRSASLHDPLILADQRRSSSTALMLTVSPTATPNSSSRRSSEVPAHYPLPFSDCLHKIEGISSPSDQRNQYLFSCLLRN